MKGLVENIERTIVLSKLLSKEIQGLEISRVEFAKNNWAEIELSCGTVFRTFPSFRLLHSFTHRRLPQELRARLPREATKCAIDIIMRFKYPQMDVLKNLNYSRRIRKKMFLNYADNLEDFPKSLRSTIIDKFQIDHGDIVVDVGAHTGFGALAIRNKIGDRGKVFCIEAEMSCYYFLQHNVDVNRAENITPINVAAWDKSESLKFRKGGAQNNSLVKINSESKTLITRNTDTIDNVLGSHGIDKINYISLTINGAEPQALKGSMNMISNSSRIAICIAGWYQVANKKVFDLVIPTLEHLGLNFHITKVGKVLAWK
ncbi:MAG: FkbM family methyltransferase [Saprospiraceae bacterium]|nr:FkbM family methyltransferase [Saprospiraceae bacterium]